ncbi:capping protein-inhibiting regulator of actin dynamics isoform X2 [Anolis sagrei]|uniref:capping protein-inhibiting regulator of actin dynamics isoform X2 n=1 Tax=Anolis sagrei TaxID=38937 RepID=UPI003520AB63
MINLLKKPYKKKSSKFQPFKKLFSRRKKRETTPDREESKLKPSSSFGNVCNGALSSDEETNNGLRSSSYSMSTRAFSHDSIFIPDGRSESEESIQAMSQDNLVGKVKTLQQQLAKNIKFGQPPQMTVSVKTIGEASSSLEADVLLSSPMETEMQQDVALPESHNKVGNIPDSLIPESLHKTRLGGEEKVTPVKASLRPKRHHSPSGTIETVNLDAIPLAITCLDNSAAKHKLSVKPKNQRVSTKHKRLSKDLQSLSVIEFEPEILEPIEYEDKILKQDGHHAEKPFQARESHEQETKGKRKQEDRLMTEKKIAETEVKSHMENKRVQGFEEDQGQQEGKKQKLQEEEPCLKMEDRKSKKESKEHMAEHEMQWHQEQEEGRKKEERSQELEEPMHSESEHQELEDQKQREVEAQKQHEEQRKHELKAQRQRKEQKQCEMEAQSQQEEQRKRDLEAQKQWEEQRQHEIESQRKQEEQRQRELRAQRKKEKERQRELEAQQEEQRRYELEAQRKQEEQRQRELKAQRKREKERQRELEAQQEEQRRYELEAKRKQEEERQREMEAQKKREEQRQHEMEAQRKQEEQRRELEAQMQREEQRKREREAQMQREEQRQRELEAQMQQEEQTKRELEAQRQHKEQRQCKMEAERHELKAQKDQEKQNQHELEAQKQSEEQRQCDMETQSRQGKQRHGKREEKNQSELEDKQQKRHQEIKEGKTYDKLSQHGWQDKKQEQEKQKWQEEKAKHRDSEGKRGQELEEKAHETEKHDELKKQVLQGQKTRQKPKEQEQTRNIEGEDSLQKKGRTTKVEKQKRPEQQKENLKAEKMNSDEQTQQEPEKHVRSAKHGKCEVTESKTQLDTKRTQQEDLLQREQGQKPEEAKILNVEGLQPQEKTKELNKLSGSQLDKNLNAEEKRVETIKKALPPKEEASQQKSEQKDKGQKKEETLRHGERRNTETQEQERIHGEELRWQEVDARQTMPRGFTFQVSSGEKQIIFPKVNLSPVSPIKETPTPSTAIESKTPKCSHDLPTSLCVPHTAILVTGAQLCGTAVNLNQIKDTACKSLLGLTEERKMADVAPAESAMKQSPDAKPSSSKIKHTQDPLGNQDILAEWASIRSKILKSAENGKSNEKDKGNTSRHSDDWTPKGRTASHSNLRKTLSANAKFSITPAWQKFSEVSKTNTDTEGKVGTEAENATAKELVPTTISAKRERVHTEPLIDVGNVPRLPASKTEVHHEVADNTEGCKFAKDLPSFLVPSGPLSKEISQPESSPNMESHQNVATRKLDRVSPNGEENVSPFGVKLRRTNYSLRFHYDQQGDQKKKKRYSAGDSFDGIPTPLVTPEGEQEPSNLFSKASKSPSQETKDASVSSGKISSSNVNQSYSTATPVSLPTSGHVSTASQEKSVCISPAPKKPALAPKPTSQTPPPSPLAKIRRPPAVESLGQRVGKAEPDPAWRKTEAKGSALVSQAPEGNKNEEEESKEKKSFFPSITMPWREKTEKKTEPLKKERPVLQSRHSIDGSKLMEKVESAQPLWITLALQKQKGFREQQATREERRQAREAKQAEKLAKENASINSQSDNKNTSRTSTLLKPAASEEEKKETAMKRLERREQLKKSNTLPTSVTVEISNSLPSSPLAKEVTKRFSSADANPVSTEPAWLALAKRKAKAWSDCPQIIK